MTGPSDMAVSPTRPTDASPLDEFSPVTLRRAVLHRGVVFPAGARGIVVAPHDDGFGYEVEFATPAEAVLSLVRTDLA